MVTHSLKCEMQKASQEYVRACFAYEKVPCTCKTTTLGCSHAHLPKRAVSWVGTEEATESAGSTVPPAVCTRYRSWERTAQLGYGVLMGGAGIAQKLRHVLSPTRLTLLQTESEKKTKIRNRKSKQRPVFGGRSCTFFNKLKNINFD